MSPVVSPSPSPPPSPAGDGVVRIAAVGDIGQGNDGERAVARAIAVYHREHPLDALLLLGDLVYPTGRAGDWRARYQRPFAAVIDAHVPIRAVLGNHDVMTDARQIMRLFEIPSRWYAFTIGPVAFFALDSSAGRIGKEQRAWLEAALGAARAPWKIVFGHVPTYSSGKHGSAIGLRRETEPLFDRFNVELVISGHDHDYERTTPQRGVTYVVAGGGCCPRAVSKSDFTAQRYAGLSFVVIEVRGNAMTLQAFDETGSPIDRTVIPPA